ncbi:immunoglobulin-like domain-containing protein [uncultured Catenibacterium sp.]|uniref:immunoglobulin-like domain-containing protein n=1 Tax=uncultured Catenibacterium sp. TaxID=286142 RepID=UPI0025DD836E|nr:immunoglobulin-like domain-containing protein [uncultured Catenibacterium sp.]
MNVKKFTSYAVALMMSFSLAPINANALTTANAVTKGYYNDSGQWVQGELDQTLPEGIHSVDKTAEALGNNTYKMKLKVVTKQKVETFTKKSATVLVVDTSGSMENTSGSTLKKRIQDLKEAANEFVKSYAGDKENVGRYLAIADFSSGVKVALNWTDVSSKDGKNNAFTAISKLKADGGTNLDAGIKQATSLFLKDAVKQIQKDNRNTVVLTDGTPTYYLEDCEGGWDTFLHTHVTIDGITYDLAGDGRKGSEKNVEATSKDAKLLKDQSTVYTVCYGAATDKTYKNGPTVSEFLKGSIATSRDKAYDSSETDDLTEVFKAISESVTTGITGKDLEVFDGSAPYVSVSQLPASVQQDTSGFKWKLANATTTTEGTQTYYTYELEYIVTLDADHPEFEEGKLYPLNGETYIAMPDGSKVKFPVPGAKGIKSRYTVTYTDGVDGEVVFEDKVFNNLVVGTPTPDFGETPTRAGYTFKGWTPAIEEKVTKDITYNATWVMNWVPMNAAPVIKATDKTIEVGDEFDPRADVTAEDVEDGDLTDKIEILKNDVNVNEPGIYDVTYKVTDTQGASYTTTIKVTVNPKAAVLNACPVIKATDKVLTVGDTFDERADVTAEDEEDGDITDKIEVLKNEVDTTKPGKYEVTYKVTDSGGASYVKTIKVTVNPKMEPLNAAPIIKAEDKTLTVGDTFDERADVTATDAEDGDLTDKIEVLKNEVDTTKAGKYEVTYKVTDSKGASYTKSITVTVNPKMEVLNAIPTIEAEDKTLTVGDTFDERADVTAADAEDGDLTDKIEVLKNEVDTTKPGKYEVTYKVTDSKGASRTKTITVTVNPKMEPLNEAPTIDVTDKEITVGDKFDPKDGVTAKDKEDGNLTDKIEILKNTVDPSKPGVYEVTYKVTDSKGASCTKTIKVTVKEKTPAPSKNNDKTTTVTPKTGDSTNVSAVIALLAVSGIALLALLKKKKLS